MWITKHGTNKSLKCFYIKTNRKRLFLFSYRETASRKAKQTQLFVGTLATRTNEGVLNKLLKSYSAGKPSAVSQ